MAVVRRMLRGNHVLALLIAAFFCFEASVVTASVSYDGRAIVVNGQRRILISGSIHYPRSSPQMWPDLIQKAKEGGLDVIQTYVFWNSHEPLPDQYYFEERFDLVRFIKLAKEAGLYVHLRIGPYICAEWNFGGLPIWLKYIPGISFRTDNELFKARMQKFTKKIVDMMKAESLFESQGGPIILSQIENEYGPLENEMGPEGQNYTKWAAQMAVELNTGVPWVMCKQDNAPDPIINTCNGFYCENFFPNKAYKPKLWTEAWTGWFTKFGGGVTYRPAEDLAFSVARFLQNRGSFVNYYMYHGGTNFGRTAGGPFIATSYDYDAPVDEYGLLNQPKWEHLKDLHKAVKLCEPALVAAEPIIITLGNYQEAHIFEPKPGLCVAFLANYNTQFFAKVYFRNKHYNLPPWSISILPDCKNTVFNTARVGAQSAEMNMNVVLGGFSWQSYSEDAMSYADNIFSVVGLLEQINVTRDVSDYLWYMTDVEINPDESFLFSSVYPILTIMSAGHALHLFINGQLSGTVYGSLENPKLTFSDRVIFIAGINKLSLLSISVGLPNMGPHFERWNAGVLGPVTLNGLDEGQRDLSWQTWSYKVGLKGESLGLHSLRESSSVDWLHGSFVPHYQSLTWYKTTFNAPSGSEPLGLDMGSMGKGQLWINGQNMGRYWSIHTAQPECNLSCNYAGQYHETKCQKYCNSPSQRWYHVPRSWVNPAGNSLVVFEECGGNPNLISLVKKEIKTVCANIFAGQPSLKSWVMQASGEVKKPLRPEAHLKCGSGQKIYSIKFASFGTPIGVCGSFSEGACHSRNSFYLLQKICVGKNSCSVGVEAEIFGDPCPGVMKKLAVEVICTS